MMDLKMAFDLEAEFRVVEIEVKKQPIARMEEKMPDTPQIFHGVGWTVRLVVPAIP